MLLITVTVRKNNIYMHKFIVAVGSGFPVDEYQKKCAYFSKRNMHSPLVNQK